MASFSWVIRTADSLMLLYISHLSSPPLPLSTWHVSDQMDMHSAGHANSHTEDCAAKAKL